MTAELLTDFFFWCMIVNSGIYAVTALAVLLPGLIVSVHSRMFKMEDKETLRTVQRYLGNFKLFITVFNFTPWIALHIIS